MVLIRKLTSLIRRQYLAALALFVVLGGTAYAAATVNSASVVDDSLTGADIKGRAASPGKPFTQGTITGADVKGSPGVNGGLTGLDFADGSIAGADISPSAQAPNSAKLGGLVPDAYGRTTRTSHEPTGNCDDSGFNQCAKVTVTVPAGKHYRAAAYTSFSAVPNVSSCTGDCSGVPGEPANSIYYCPAITSSTVGLTCLTPDADLVSLAPSYAETGAAAGETSALGFDLGAGTWTFSTMLHPNGSLGQGSSWEAHTTVVVTDAAAPEPSGVVGTSGSSGTCGTSGSSGGVC